MLYETSVYDVFMHCFEYYRQLLGASPPDPTGELPLDPAGGLPSFRPLTAHPGKNPAGAHAQSRVQYVTWCLRS